MVTRVEQKLESDWTLVLRPIAIDRTRPVVKCHFWNLTGNDRTLEAQRPVSGGSQRAASVSRPDAGSESDRRLEAVSGPIVR